MSASQTERRIDRGFTLIELLVVIAIIILLVGVLLPALSSARDRAKKTSVQIQLEGISAACISYQLEYGVYPGYFTETELADTINAEFSGTENLVISLMGYVEFGPSTFYQPTGSSMTGVDSIDLDRIGDGPMTRQGVKHSPFYSPAARELDAVGGETGSEPDMPELVDLWQGMPVLYYRVQRGATVPVSTDSSGTGAIYRNVNAKYFTSTGLTNELGDVYIQNGISMLSPSGAGSAGAANNNLAWATINRKLSGADTRAANPAVGDANEADDVARGGFVLIAAGKDGVYFDKDALESGTDQFKEFSEVDAMDEVIVFGGER